VPEHSLKGERSPNTRGVLLSSCVSAVAFTQFLHGWLQTQQCATHITSASRLRFCNAGAHATKALRVQVAPHQLPMYRLHTTLGLATSLTLLFPAVEEPMVLVRACMLLCPALAIIL
jgi:hypothetical protein